MTARVRKKQCTAAELLAHVQHAESALINEIANWIESSEEARGRASHVLADMVRTRAWGRWAP